MECWCLSTAVYGGKVRYTKDRLPAHRKATQRHTTMDTNPKGNLGTPIYLTDMFFGLCEEAGIPGDNPRRHRENMLTAWDEDPMAGRPNTFLIDGNSATNYSALMFHQ